MLLLVVIGAILLVNNAINIQYAYGSCDDFRIIKRIDQLEQKVIDAIQDPQTVPKSCEAIFNSNPNVPSGLYTINSGLRAQDKKVFCHMGTLPGCGRGGWRRIANLPHRKSANGICPKGFKNFLSGGKVACQRAEVGCASLKFSPAQRYKEVCGMFKGYQIGTSDAFARYSSRGNINDINTPYVDGVSITQGSPRRHLWSYAAARNSKPPSACPCTTGYSGKSPPIPNFIKNNNYYCESYEGGVNNVLWDGQQCSTADKSGCCNRPNMPWFHRKDITESSDYIEIRLCADESLENERIPIFQYQLFVR